MILNIISLYFLDKIYSSSDEQNEVDTSETSVQIQTMVDEVNKSVQPEQSRAGQVPRAEDHVPVAHAHFKEGIIFRSCEMKILACVSYFDLLI